MGLIAWPRIGEYSDPDVPGCLVQVQLYLRSQGSNTEVLNSERLKSMELGRLASGIQLHMCG